MVGTFKAKIMEAINQRQKQAGDEIKQSAMSAAELGQALADAMHMPLVQVAQNPPFGNGPQLGSPGQVLGPSGWLNSPTTATAPRRTNLDNDRLLDMLAMRMRWEKSYAHMDNAYPTPFLDVVVSQRPGTVLVMIVMNEEHLVLEDDELMFPSDKLITKIRMLTP